MQDQLLDEKVEVDELNDFVRRLREQMKKQKNKVPRNLRYHS